MIYLYNWSKKNIYTKLDDVLNIKNGENIQNEYYEELGKTTNTNYQTFTQKMREKQSRAPIQPFKKPAFQQNNSMNNSNRSKFKSPDRIYAVCEKSKEDVFLNNFKNAIKKNSDLITNSDSCVKELERYFRKCSSHKILEEKEIKIEDFKTKYKKEEENFLDQINIKVERNKKIYGGDCDAEQTSTTNSKIYPHLIIKLESHMMNPIKRRETNIKMTSNLKKKVSKIIYGALSYLFFNNISIIEYQEKNPFPLKPYSLKHSLEFFEAVKFNKIEVVEDILKISKDYLFDYDYFHQTGYHWAAKRGFKDLLEVLIRKGVHVNLFDFNNRTPLFLAALNNHREICLILLSCGANPFLEDKEGKKPVEVTTDGSVKQLLMKTMEHKSDMNASNYFKERILKKHKEDVAFLFNNKGKERQNRSHAIIFNVIR